MATKAKENTDNNKLLYDLIIKQIDQINDDIKFLKENNIRNKDDVLKQITDIKENLIEMTNNITKDMQKDLLNCKDTCFRPLEKKTDNMSWKLGIIVVLLMTVGIIVIKSITSDAITAIKNYKSIQLMEKYEYVEPKN